MADDKEFFPDNLIAEVPLSAYTLTNATLDGDVFIIDPNGSIAIEVLFDVGKRFACYYLRHKVVYKGSTDISANFTPKGQIFFDIHYTNDPKSDNNIVLFNKDEQDGDRYVNLSYVPTRNKEVNKLTMRIVNKSEAPLYIYSVEIFKSKDFSPYQIVDVLKEQVITADVIHTTANFSEAVFTQYLQTNVFSMSALGSLISPQVDYMIAQDWTLDFRTATLSSTEKEQFYIDVQYADGSTKRYYFWYAIIGDHPDAYKYLTTIDPREKFPSISDEDRDAFRFMVYKKESDVSKLSIQFVQFDDGQGGKVTGPMFILGAGSSEDPNSLLGKFVMYKDYTGVHLKYTTQTGKVKEFHMDEYGVYAVGMYNRIDFIEEYDDMIKLKFIGDPSPLVLEPIYDESNKFLGILVNNNDFVPYTRKSGSGKGV